MSEMYTAVDNVFADHEGGSVAPGIDSRFRLVILAGKRTKQLLRGASARVEGDHKRRKGTSIALEELKLGLVRFASQVAKP
jgi:DNA-directed RNA polymerase omega subunit